MKSICVFGASAAGIDPAYIEKTKALGEKLGKAGYSLVFGGFGDGLMKASADGFYAAGAQITGVVPKTLMSEYRSAHPGCTEVIVTEDLTERKTKMEELSDIFLAVPGGIGTMDELFGVLAEKFAEGRSKPVVLFNPDGFYNPLIAWLNQLLEKGFLYCGLDKLFYAGSDPDEIIKYLKQFE